MAVPVSKDTSVSMPSVSVKLMLLPLEFKFPTQKKTPRSEMHYIIKHQSRIDHSAMSTLHRSNSMAHLQSPMITERPEGLLSILKTDVVAQRA